MFFKIEKDIDSKNIFNLYYSFLENNIYANFIKNNSIINFNSLINLLKIELRNGDIIKIILDKEENKYKLKKILATIGREIDGGELQSF